MMENDDLGRYKGSCTGKWAGQSGRGPSDATKVVFAWDNLESAAKKTITFHIRIFRITGSGAGAAAGASSDSFAIDDEVTENHIYSSSNSCACNHPIISTRAPQSAINARTTICNQCVHRNQTHTHICARHHSLQRKNNPIAHSGSIDNRRCEGVADLPASIMVPPLLPISPSVYSLTPIFALLVSIQVPFLTHSFSRVSARFRFRYAA
jgi:hypothetical protein